MGPDALTSPPPGSASGLNFVCIPSQLTRSPLPAKGRNHHLAAGIYPASLSGAALTPGAVRRRMMKKLLVVLALTSGLVLAACNTVEGAAHDVESVTDCADGQDNNC